MAEMPLVRRIQAPVRAGTHAVDDGDILFFHAVVIQGLYQSRRFTQPVSKDDLIAVLYEGSNIFGRHDPVCIFFFPVHDILHMLPGQLKIVKIRSKVLPQ